MEQVEQRGAQVQRVTLVSKLQMALRNHVVDAKASFNELRKNPVATLMTVFVLGIALALPSGLHVLLKNSQSLTQGMDNSSKLSLFLHKEVTKQQTVKLLEELALWEEIAKTHHIPSETALIQFQNSSGFGDAISFLSENPLPDVIEITPTYAASQPETATVLLAKLEALEAVEIAQLDLEWVRKFHSMLSVARQATQMIAVLFALAVLLIIGNTIRLSIQNKREEIEIIKLVGATDGFIQRPFLYSGLLYGLAAAILAWLIVNLSLLWIEPPINQLISLYDSAFSLRYLDFSEMISLIFLSCLLGLIGSWASVSRHLKAVEPR